MISEKNLEMQNVRVWEKPKQSIGKFSRCRAVYAEWAGHGDPEGFDFSFESFVRDSRYSIL